MLHITNGDVVAEKLARAGLPGDVVAWREAYTFGPAFADMRGGRARGERAEAFARLFGVPRETYVRTCEAQERRLDEALRRGEEIVLWFEHDLYDQTMLCLLLANCRRSFGMRAGTGRTDWRPGSCASANGRASNGFAGLRS